MKLTGPQQEAIIQQLVATTYRTANQAGPEIDRDRPLRIALFGSVKGYDWREKLTTTDMGDRPIEWYDPRTTYIENDPRSRLAEFERFHDDIRVVAAMEDTTSRNSLFEIAHLLEVHLDTSPLVVYVASEMATINGDETDRAASNYWRARVRDMLEQYRDHPNLYITESLDELIEITQAIALQWQAEPVGLYATAAVSAFTPKPR